jgi:hypothetical protein
MKESESDKKVATDRAIRLAEKAKREHQPWPNKK